MARLIDVHQTGELVFALCDGMLRAWRVDNHGLTEVHASDALQALDLMDDNPSIVADLDSVSQPVLSVPATPTWDRGTYGTGPEEQVHG